MRIRLSFLAEGGDNVRSSNSRTRFMCSSKVEDCLQLDEEGRKIGQCIEVNSHVSLCNNVLHRIVLAWVAIDAIHDQTNYVISI